MIDFNNTTGKNKGKLQVTKLANFLDKNESTLRAMKKRDDKYFNIIHLGALCVANNIKEKDLIKCIKNT